MEDEHKGAAPSGHVMILTGLRVWGCSDSCMTFLVRPSSEGAGRLSCPRCGKPAEEWGEWVASAAATQKTE